MSDRISRPISDQAFKVRGDQSKERLRARLFVELCKVSGLPLPRLEFAFAAPARRWRFDFAWEDQRVALEVEGGLFVRGAHTRPAKFLADLEKYNTAALCGWRVLRTIPDQLLTSDTTDMLRVALGVAAR